MMGTLVEEAVGVLVAVKVAVAVEVEVLVKVAVGVDVLATTVITAPFTGAPLTWMLFPDVNPCPVKPFALATLSV